MELMESTAMVRPLSSAPRFASGERTFCLEGGEHVKSVATLERLLTWLADIDLERKDPLVVVGGGTVGDVTGLAAALHRRGVPRGPVSAAPRRTRCLVARGGR
jgi:3-dehydroquinate synthetase